MNKPNAIKITATAILTIFYSIISIFWCYIIINNMVYNLLRVNVHNEAIGIIGGADMPTTMYIMGEIFNLGFSALFLIICIVTVLLLNFSIFKKIVSKKFSITLCVFSVLSPIIFMLVPVQSYVISLYSVDKVFLFTKYIQIIYIIISVFVIVRNIFEIKNIKEKNL